MIRHLYAWLMKHLFDAHVCEEFTRWNDRCCVVERAATGHEAGYAGWKTAKYWKRWQERACTICGKIEVRDLPDNTKMPGELQQKEDSET